MITQLINFSPLLLVITFWSLPFLGHISTSVQRFNSSLALLLFGQYVTRNEAETRERADLIRAARLEEMYRLYASKTILYSAYAALGGAIAGVYAFLLLIRLINTPDQLLNQFVPAQFSSIATGLTVSNLSRIELLIALLISTATVGAALGILTYMQRWSTPKERAEARALQIEESLPRTVAFMFALSRSGMSHQKVIDTLVRNANYFGGAAEEFDIGRRDINVLNSDFLTAMQRVARTSPSKEFASFAEDLANVLRTGQSLPDYLYEEYEQYKRQKEDKQEQILEEISALAEGYVALLVAGPLFLITLLVVIGLLVGGTLAITRVFVYLLVPLTNIGFILYLDRFASNLGLDSTIKEPDTEAAIVGSEPDEFETQPSQPGPENLHADGGTDVDVANRQRLHAYNQLEGLREWVTSPLRSAIRSPTSIIYPVGTLTFLYVVLRVYFSLTAGNLTVRTADDILVQATIVTFAVFAIFQYINTQRIDRIEDALPDFIERLADSAGAGMSLTKALERLEPESIPNLQTEIRELQQDVTLGYKTSRALTEFAKRTRSVLMLRAVVLINNANRASNNIAPVLRIAADEALLDRRLKRRRREDLLIYRIIIYMSFVIFIGIVAALVLLFIPSIPSEVSTPGIGSGGSSGTDSAVPSGGLSGIGLDFSSTAQDAYVLLLFHSMLIQGVFAGLVAGKMSEGTVKAGIKHSTIMLTLGYIATLLI